MNLKTLIREIGLSFAEGLNAVTPYWELRVWQVFVGVQLLIVLIVGVGEILT